MKSEKWIKARYKELLERARINGHISYNALNPRLWGRLKELELILEIGE